MSGADGAGDPAEGPSRLDPDRAASEARRGADPGKRLPTQPIDTRRYQWMVGILGLALVIGFSVYLYLGNRHSTVGIPAGRPIHKFVAPLATSNLDASANPDPRCDPSRPARRGLNVCGRRPIVLGFFVTGASSCVNEVDTMQTVSGDFPKLQFAAVAIDASKQKAESLVRSHHWTIPIAYDSSGVIGQIYGVAVCPLLELVRRGGVVKRRLIGNGWLGPSALRAAVNALAPGGGARAAAAGASG